MMLVVVMFFPCTFTVHSRKFKTLDETCGRKCISGKVHSTGSLA